jgi:beta-mannosidase
MGALLWQFNDAWPGMSWSLIDSHGRLKPAYFAVQRAFGRINP